MSNIRTSLESLTNNLVDNILRSITGLSIDELTEIARPPRRGERAPTATSVATGRSVGTLTKVNGKFVVRTATRTYTSTRRRDVIRRARERGIEVVGV